MFEKIMKIFRGIIFFKKKIFKVGENFKRFLGYFNGIFNTF